MIETVLDLVDVIVSGMLNLYVTETLSAAEPVPVVPSLPLAITLWPQTTAYGSHLPC